jgi:hypothetical protein
MLYIGDKVFVKNNRSTEKYGVIVVDYGCGAYAVDIDNKKYAVPADELVLVKTRSQLNLQKDISKLQHISVNAMNLQETLKDFGLLDDSMSDALLKIKNVAVGAYKYALNIQKERR